VPDLLLSFFFLGAPILAWIAGAVLAWSAYSDLRSRPAGLEATALARLRLPVYFALSATAVIFGLVLWLLLAGLETEFGALQGSFYTVVPWMAIGFAFVASAVIGSQALLARGRLREFVGIHFGRVLPVLVIPSTAVIFDLVLSFLVYGRLSDLLSRSSVLSDTTAARFVLVFQVFAISALANPAGIVLSFRVRDITTTHGFVRTLYFADVASVASVLALAWGFLQLSGA